MTDPDAERVREEWRRADRWAALATAVLCGCCAAVLMKAGGVVLLGSVQCYGVRTCSTVGLNAGMGMVRYLPSLLVLAGSVVAVVRERRGGFAFPVLGVTAVLLVAAVIVGGGVVGASTVV